ncbi:ABC transporter ATP-binding protein [Chryseosolibacter indicus]|uniref:ABC transporter ATP-binding protein/permease n=1 Tax=Chryseosolibacter indicus TaxID=2782351 RepID=A0ABS5VTP8_9BACT|nr:ABC transporter ATP-binding protein [Chryseosolibacter indicus]MBT1704802.1 ABC transporter ATP-binding protein/permease [Chryseosolibacter indicus]
MKIYLRILQYAPNINSRIVKFILFSFLGAAFGASYLGLLKPLLEVIFLQNTAESVPAYPAFSLSVNYVRDLFNYHFLKIIEENGQVRALLFVCISIIVLVLISNIFRYMERMVASRIKVDVVKNIRMDIFRNVSRLEIAYFNDQRKGDLISRFTNDVGEVEGTVLNSLKAVKEPITLIIHIGILFSISVKLTLFTLIVLPVTGYVISTIIKRLKKKAKQSQESMGRIVNILDETFGSMRVINAFNARQFLTDKIDAETSYHRKVNLSISRKNELAAPLSEFLGIIVVATILYFGGHSVLSGTGDLSPASFIVFLVFFTMMIQPAKNFSNGLTSLQKGISSAERIFKIIDTKPAIQSKANAVILTKFSEAIEFVDVSFAYDKEPVLRNIHLKIQKGKTIALVGPSGGGKSTLADLIPRFYDPTSGDVRIDGISLRDCELESLRGQIGVVTQESILFNDTIFNNIAFGMKDMKEEDVIRAAKIAHAHDFIMQTEDGYQTVIGERGSKLSGGQRQRISIARAVLKNPPILILDEATSALDSESERLVQDALFSLMKNRTSIVIAHRLSTIQHADEIIVIQDGQVIERGKHDSLILQNGLYRKLNEIQRM